MFELLLGNIREARKADPVAFLDLLKGQREFITATEREIVWFGFNGCGKTNALARRLIRVFDGTDPICKEARRPLRILLIVSRYDSVSSRDLAEQLFNLCPPGLIAQVPLGDDGKPVSRALPWYAPGKGFRGRPPRIVVQRGPMKGSVVNLSTLGSGVLASAGGTIDLIVVNEPITEELHNELVSRDRVDALGHLWYPFTPTIGAPDQTWIPDMVKATREAGGSIRFIQTALTRDALILPSGRPLESWEKKTAPRIARWSRHEEPMRAGRSLEPMLDGCYFSDVWKEGLVIDTIPPGLSLWLVGSLDHSLREGRMRIGVTGFSVQGVADTRRLVAYDLIDTRATGANIDEAAQLFLDDLYSANIKLEQIDQWVGDRSTVDQLHLVRRDNRDWVQAVLRAIRSPRRCPPGVNPATIRVPKSLYGITTPKKWAGSSWHNMAQLRSAMAEEPPRLYIHRRCAHIQDDLLKWQGDAQSPHKDGLDRLGYAWERAHRHWSLWRR